MIVGDRVILRTKASPIFCVRKTKDFLGNVQVCYWNEAKEDVVSLSIPFELLELVID
jgi:hypothetical protein